MKFFENNKFIFKLIASLCIFLAIINFGMSPKAFAEDEESGVGGILLGPLSSLLAGLGDGIMQILHKMIMGTDATVTYDNTEDTWYEVLGRIITFAVIVVAVVAVVVAITVATTGMGTGPALAFIGGAISSFLTSSAVVGGVITTGVVLIADQVFLNGAIRVSVTSIISTALGDNVVFPLFTYGPAEIFSGRILLLDPNIFDPKEVFVKVSGGGEEYEVTKDEWDLKDHTNLEVIEIYGQDEYGNGGVVKYRVDYNSDEMTIEEWNEKDDEGKYVNRNGLEVEKYFYKEDGKEIATSMNNSAYELKQTVSKWYYIIRNISIVGLMLVLLYVGIRMLLSTVASEKSKYKQMFTDWVVGVCLIFLLHYIMVFGHYFTEKLTLVLNTSSNGDMYSILISEPKDNLVQKIKEGYPEMIIKDGENNDMIEWPTNMMGVIRFKAQERNNGILEYVGYTICYFTLVILTATFTFTYIKRLLMLLFLTVIAPFVAFTYPIDKLRDGKAQAFDFWLKEYITNLLIQPFHLLLYTIFITMAFDLASTNIIYSLVVIGFMVPSEKILRKIFSLDKAESAGLLSGATGAAMAISAMNSLSKFANNKKKKEGNRNEDEKKDKINFMNRGADDGKTSQSLMKKAVNRSGGANNTEGTSDANTTGNNVNGTGEISYMNGTEDTGDTDWTGNTSYTDGTEDTSYIDENGYMEDAEGTEDTNNTEEMNGANSDNTENNVNGEEDGNNTLYDDEQAELDRLDKEGKVKEYLKKRWSILKREKLNKEFMSKYMKARAANFAKRNLNKKKITGMLSTGGKFLAKVGLGALGAGIGISSGIASGKFENVGKNLIAGTAAGSAIGEGLYNRGEDFIKDSIKNSKQINEEAMKDSMTEKEYQERLNRKMDQEFKYDPETRKLFEQKFNTKNRRELNEIMNQACRYRENGITDNDTIIKAMKLNGNNRVDDKSLAAAKLSLTSKSEKDLESTMKRFKKETGLGDNDPQLKEMERRIRTINDML